MSSTDSTIKQILKLQKQMNRLIRSLQSGTEATTASDTDSSVSSTKKKTKGGDKLTRKPNAWSSWVKEVNTRHASEFATYRTDNPELKGHAIQFAKVWRDAHAAEYDTFAKAHAAGAAAEAVVATVPVAVEPVAAPVVTAVKAVKKVAKKAE